jgi:hypothetical protein
MVKLSQLLETPPWVRLRFVSNSTAAKSTILVPLIGYLIIFNANVVSYLNLAREFGIQQNVGVSHRLILIYLGLCAISVGVLLYGWFCPNEVKHYGSAAAFVQGDGPSLRGFVMNDIQVLIAKIEPYKTKIEELSYDLSRKSDLTGLDDSDRERYRIENLHLYFGYLNLSHLGVRSAVFWAYIMGFGLLAIPSLEVFLKVMWLLMKLIAGLFT